MIATANQSRKPRHWARCHDRVHGVPGDGEGGDQSQQVQRPGSVPGADPAEQRGHDSARKVIFRTHLVLCTPGAAGMIVRAG